MTRVRFSDVGPSRKTWEAELSDPYDWGQLIRAIRKANALASRGIDVELDKDDDRKGTIYVGGFRPVGRFEVLAPSPEEESRG